MVVRTFPNCLVLTSWCDVHVCDQDEKKDFWRRTYYKPLVRIILCRIPLMDVLKMIKDDGHFYFTRVADAVFRVETSFTVHPVNQFDQGGLCVRYDENNWMKLGVELVDGRARQSCVVTRDGYSDWSTKELSAGPQSSFALQLRVYIDGDSVLCEARPTSDSEWFIFRVAHLPRHGSPQVLVGRWVCRLLAGSVSLRTLN